MEENNLIRRYNRSRRVVFWAIVALCLVVLVMSSLTFVESPPRPAQEDFVLGPGLSSDGRMVLLAAMRDGLQEVLISRDSGKIFTRTESPWPLRDSAPFMGIAPDSQSIVVLERNGTLHYLPVSCDNIQTDTIHGFSDANPVRGFFFIRDSFYVYGETPHIVAASWNFPREQAKYVVDGAKEIVSLDADSAGECVALVKSVNNRIEVYAGKTVRNISHDSSGKSINSIKNLVLDFNDTTGFHFTKQFIDNSGKSVYFGGGPFIQQGTSIDSIPMGGIIRSLSLRGNRPTLAILYNNGINYLVEKKENSWIINPVVTLETKYKNIQAALSIPVAACMIFIVWWRKRCLDIHASIKIRMEPNELVTKTEKPLTLQDEDLLGFAAIEEAITRIIRNPAVGMPMTIVVNGSWGSGKSSIMNRVREGLQQRQHKGRFMTTWVNAWHIQGEKSLLNSFLLNIIQCYERFYTPVSPFRIRIALARYMRLPFWKKFAFGFAAAMVTLFIFSLFLQVIPHGLRVRLGWIGTYCAGIHSVLNSGKGLTTDLFTPLGIVVLLILSVLFVKKQYIPAGLSTFFELVPHDSLSLDVEKDEIGSREKFRQEYWEIVAAGTKGTIVVVFIDDIDRTSGDKILELLEGINFISDTASRPPSAMEVEPNTIFVLGMDTREVARLVGSQLKKVNGSEESAEVLGARYIEKMVQLVVPVPFDSDDKEKLKRLYEN